MLSNEEYRKLVDDKQMIEYIRSFREMDNLSIPGNSPTPEEVMRHIEVVAKNEETFVSFIILCDRLDRRDKAFTNLTAYHTLITGANKYENKKDYVDLFYSSLKQDSPVEKMLSVAIDFEDKEKRDGKLLKI